MFENIFCLFCSVSWGGNFCQYLKYLQSRAIPNTKSRMLNNAYSQCYISLLFCMRTCRYLSYRKKVLWRTNIISRYETKWCLFLTYSVVWSAELFLSHCSAFVPLFKKSNPQQIWHHHMTLWYYVIIWTFQSTKFSVNPHRVRWKWNIKNFQTSSL